MEKCLLTKKRKAEIFKLIDDGHDDIITREEAEEFLKIITSKEKELVYEKIVENNRKRNAKARFDRIRKAQNAQNNRIYWMHNICSLFDIDGISLQRMYDICKDFANEFLTEKEPVANMIEEIGTFYDCPDCGLRLKKYQAFCEACGRLMNWENIDE